MATHIIHDGTFHAELYYSLSSFCSIIVLKGCPFFTVALRIPQGGYRATLTFNTIIDGITGTVPPAVGIGWIAVPLAVHIEE
jgi:hypothetical protein